MSDSSPSSPVLLFDGVCSMCNGSVDFILKHEAEPTLRFAPLQSEVGSALAARHGIDAERLESLVLVDGERAYQGSCAVIEVAKRLRFPWNLARFAIIVPSGVRDFFYRFVARHRYKVFGKRDACRLPSPDERERFLETVTPA